jgi:hypothetical protein
MYISKKPSGCASLKISAKVEFETSPSTATTSPRAEPTPPAPRRTPSGSHLEPDLVARQLERAGLERRALARLGFATSTDVPQPAELLDRRVGIVERFAVPALLVLDRLHALALDRPRDHDVGLPWSPPPRVGRVDRLDVVPSISIACQPNASRAPLVVELPLVHRRPRWPSRLTSKIAVRLSSS